MNLDEVMKGAAGDVHDSFDRTPPPGFEPPSTSSVGPRLVAGAAALAIVAGGWLALRPDRSDGTVIETPVATQPPTSLPAEPAELVTDLDPRPISSMDRPGVDLVTEPDFGTSIRRLSSASTGEVVTPVYSGTQSFNADGSLVLLYRTGTASVAHLVVDPSTGEIVATLELEASDIEDLAWDATNPDLLRYVRAGSNELVAHDVQTGDVDTEAVFDGCDTVDGGETSGSTSSGTDLIGLLCHRADGSSELIGYDTSSGREVGERVPTQNDAAPIALASGSGFVVVASDHLEVFDAQLAPAGAERIEFVASSFALAVDGSGRDVLVATSFSDPAVGTVVTVDLLSGEVTVVAGPDSGYPYPPTGSVLASAPGGSTRVVVATDPDGSIDEPLAGEVVLVDLGASTPTVSRLAHHRMNATDGPWAQPQVALSPDGALVLFSSDWGSDSTDTYVIDLG